MFISLDISVTIGFLVLEAKKEIFTYGADTHILGKDFKIVHTI